MSQNHKNLLYSPSYTSNSSYISAYKIKSGFLINSVLVILKKAQITLDSGIDVPNGINVAPGNLGKRTNCSPLNTPFLLISFFKCSINEPKHYHFSKKLINVALRIFGSKDNQIAQIHALQKDAYQNNK